MKNKLNEKFIVVLSYILTYYIALGFFYAPILANFTGLFNIISNVNLFLFFPVIVFTFLLNIIGGFLGYIFGAIGILSILYFFDRLLIKFNYEQFLTSKIDAIIFIFLMFAHLMLIFLNPILTLSYHLNFFAFISFTFLHTFYIIFKLGFIITKK